jgi:hypothetical protein
MAMKQIARVAALLCASLLSVSGAQAYLIGILGGQAVYDNETGLSWMENANLAAAPPAWAKHVPINPDGSMSWQADWAFIAAMNAANYLGTNQWALPTTPLGDTNCSEKPASSSFGYECKLSQMGDLFYNKLGSAKGTTIVLMHNSNYALFNAFLISYTG